MSPPPVVIVKCVCVVQTLGESCVEGDAVKASVGPSVLALHAVGYYIRH